MEIFKLADRHYEKGNLDVAFKIFLDLAKSGDIDSMSRVAIMFADGEGTPRDYKKSIYWDKKAAKLGSATSMLNLGITWRTLGELSKSRDCFIKALAAGNGEAALQLGKMYMFSQKELDTAKAYLQIAVKHKSISQDSINEAKKLLDSRLFRIKPKKISHTTP